MLSYSMGVLLFGGFYDFSVSAIAACVVAEILFHYYKKKPIYQKKRNYILWIPGFLVIWSVLVSFWALDASENVLGILRGITVLLWMYRCFLMEEEEKQRCFEITPYLGASMVTIGLLSLLNDKIASFLWQADRLGGFFQYSNTCALFFFLGIVILVQNDFLRQKVINTIVLALLILGVFLTGSRSVLLLLLGWGIYKALRVKRFRVPVIVLTGICLGISYCYGIMTGSSQNIARIFTLFSSNSTILGRILYAIDALSIAVEYPMGLGYMGYHYIQPAMQTGVYTTMFVHNDFLQLMVDYGFVALAAGLFYLGYQLIKGKQTVQKKEMIIVILIAALADFNLQYMSILMLLVLCLDLGEKDRRKKESEVRENYIFFGIAFAAAVYFTIAFGAFYLGKNSVTLTMFPKYTKAQIEELEMCVDKEKAVFLADEILVHNEYASEAYHVKVYAAAMDGDISSMTEYMGKTLDIRRYDVETYGAYDTLLEELCEIHATEGDTKSVEELMMLKDDLPERLKKLEKETHPLAFKLRDVPRFEW